MSARRGARRGRLLLREAPAAALLQPVALAGARGRQLVFLGRLSERAAVYCDSRCHVRTYVSAVEWHPLCVSFGPHLPPSAATHRETGGVLAPACPTGTSDGGKDGGSAGG